MADLSDVQNSIVALATQAIYPNGTSSPSVANFPVKIYPGWPNQSQLDADLANKISHVTVFQIPGTRNTTRYAPKQHVMSVVTPTIALVEGNGTLTVTGTIPVPFSPHNVAAIIDNAAFIYPVQPSDTLTSIATGLASSISAAYPGTSNSGPVITLPSGVKAEAARVGTTGTVTTEWEREASMFQATVWSATPDIRTAIGKAIRTAFAKIAFMIMPDGFGANIKFMRENPLDVAQKAMVYRRDMFYEVEFATTETQNIATVVAYKISVQSEPSGKTVAVIN